MSVMCCGHSTTWQTYNDVCRTLLHMLICNATEIKVYGNTLYTGWNFRESLSPGELTALGLAGALGLTVDMCRVSRSTACFPWPSDSLLFWTCSNSFLFSLVRNWCFGPPIFFKHKSMCSARNINLLDYVNEKIKTIPAPKLLISFCLGKIFCGGTWKGAQRYL